MIWMEVVMVVEVEMIVEVKSRAVVIDRQTDRQTSRQKI
jgi:hypothetical protein